MMVLSRVTVGSGYSDFLKGEGQKVYMHNLKAFGVCVCARARPSACVVTTHTKVCSSISLYIKVGLKTCIKFPFRCTLKFDSQ